jgi:hypothetical protein
MNSWYVIYWKKVQKTSGSHAQLSERIIYVKPEPKDISRRYFTNYKSANSFAKSVFDRGFYANIIKE